VRSGDGVGQVDDLAALFDGSQADAVGLQRSASMFADSSSPHVRRRSAAGSVAPEALERCDAKFASAWWHWWFFAQQENPAERVIGADPETWLVGWSTEDGMEQIYGDLVAVWRPWCDTSVEGRAIESTHHMAERAPEQLAKTLTEFLVSS